MADGALRVAVTGAAGYLGGRLIERLHVCDKVGYILATDIRRGGFETRLYRDRVEFVRLDVTEPFPNLLAHHEINTVIHLAYMLNPGRRADLARRVNVSGTDHVIEACSNADVNHIIYLSSTSVYGAHPDNPEFLTEEDPVRPIPGFQYSEDKAAAEKRLTDFAEAGTGSRPAPAVTILRVCPVMGPHADNFIANAFLKPVLPRVGSANPPMQFVHEDDLTEVVLRCLETKTARPGEAAGAAIYNVAGDGTITWDRMTAVMGRRVLKLPPVAWRSITSLAWGLGLQSDSPACGLDFIRYRWTASAAKLKRELGVRLRYTSSEAWESFAAQSQNR